MAGAGERPGGVRGALLKHGLCHQPTPGLAQLAGALGSAGRGAADLRRICCLAVLAAALPICCLAGGSISAPGQGLSAQQSFFGKWSLTSLT